MNDRLEKRMRRLARTIARQVEQESSTFDADLGDCWDYLMSEIDELLDTE